jgi:Zn-dependent protease with chaperone function
MSGYSTLLTALGWSLLNSIWQMAVVWTAYSLLTLGNKRISAAGKHNLALLFVVIGSGWIITSFFQLLHGPANNFVSGFIPVSQTVNRWIPFVSSIYLLVLMARFLKYGFRYFDRIKNISEKCISPLWQTFVDRHARLLGISKRVRVYLSDLAETAETSGYFKPLILLPVTLLTRLSPAQLEAILIHELFHIRRNDYLINICISCFHCLLFFNPFAQLFYKEISRERENACDDEVIERGYAPSLYAEALFCLEKFRQVNPGFSMAADGNKPWLLMERIRRVLGKPAIKKKRFNPFLFFCLVTSIGLYGLQQKTSLHEAIVLVPASPVPISQLHYETADLTIKWPVKAYGVKSPLHRKTVIKKTPATALPEMEAYPDPTENEDPGEKTFFAENNIERNFSNQQAAGLNTETIEPVPGTPYVPSVSLSYEALADLTQADSIREIDAENRVKEMFSNARFMAASSLKQMQKEMAKNREKLKKMEIKNKQLILRHQRNIKPLLEKIQQQLQIKKLEIDQLKIRLQVSDEEIIHI